MKLLLARHGQTDWNDAQRFQGQSDVPLNDTGRQQAAALGKRLACERIDLICVSDLGRARETASLIAAPHGCKIRTDSRLREIHFGDWEGLTYDEVRQRDPSTLAAWEADLLTTSAPNGETLNELTTRIQSLLDDLRAQHANKTILIVAHGGPLQILLCLALSLPPSCYWQFHLSPASLSEIAFYPAGAILNLLNDTCHLEGIHGRQSVDDPGQ